MTALPYPFLSDTFLSALETSGSVCPDTGWEPIHLKSKANKAEYFMPLYLKEHSMGEYVFDYSWANAYHQHGIDYYPKLVTSIPFTPSVGQRIRSDSPVTMDICQDIIDEVIHIADETGASSWHCLFPDESLLDLMGSDQLLKRSAVQYHWCNSNYESFDHYLSFMTARKRKTIKKERSEVAGQGITVEVLEGNQISETIWSLFFHLYERTYAKRNGTKGYLNSDFFKRIASGMSEQIAMSVATKNNQPIACALYLFDSNTLYGRYWGSLGEFPFLHFELCYYKGIEFAISRGLQRYDAGAQGEHKLMRGFQPILTHSLHWIAEPEFRAAIQRFLAQETMAIQHHLDQAIEMLPFKKI